MTDSGHLVPEWTRRAFRIPVAFLTVRLFVHLDE